MVNQNPIGDTRSVEPERFVIDGRHRRAALQVSTALSLSPGWEVLQENHQAYAGGMDKNPRPLEPMDHLQLGMIEALDGRRVAVNVSMTAVRQDDDAASEPEIVLNLSLYADGELLESFSRRRNILPASFYAKLDIVVRS